jgi:hypothetical protein
MIGPKTPKPNPAEERRARADVKKRDRGVCVKCLRVHPIHGVNWDHRKNASQGGLVVASNGQLLCGSGTTGCHGWKTNSPARACAEGWAVPGWADPLTYPARRWQSTGLGTFELIWVLYRDDGSWDRVPDEEAVRRINEGRMYEGAA